MFFGHLRNFDDVDICQPSPLRCQVDRCRGTPTPTFWLKVRWLLPWLPTEEAAIIDANIVQNSEFSHCCLHCTYADSNILVIDWKKQKTLRASVVQSIPWQVLSFHKNLEKHQFLSPTIFCTQGIPPPFPNSVSRVTTKSTTDLSPTTKNDESINPYSTERLLLYTIIITAAFISYFTMMLFSLSKSSPIQFLFFAVVILATTTKSSADAKILDVVFALFDAPNRVDTMANAPGHFAEKTVEFLAFGDAAMDYYQ